MPIPREQIAADDRLLDELARELGVSLEELLRNYQRELRILVQDPEEYAGVSATGLAATYLGVQIALRRAGRNRLLNRHAEKFPNVARSAVNLFRESGTAEQLNWMSGVQGELRGAINIYRRHLVSELDSKLVAPIQSAVVSQALGSFDGDTVTAVLSASETLSVKQATRLVDNQYMSFSRAIKAETANRLGLSVFVYSGPLDKVTSPQCRELLLSAPHGVPGYWLKSEIKPGMVPGTEGVNVLLQGGHYNCRHSWFPITEEEARADGFKN